MPPRVKKYALIWRIECAKKDVIPLTNIPKNDRKTELHRILVTKEGTIHDPVNKIFTSEVLSHNKKFAESKKLRNSMVRSAKIHSIEKIKQDLPIFHGLHKPISLSTCNSMHRCADDKTSNTCPINLTTETTYNCLEPQSLPVSPMKLILATAVSESITLINPLSYLPHDNEMDTLPYSDLVQQSTGMEIQQSAAAKKSSMEVRVNDTCNHFESKRVESSNEDNERLSTSSNNTEKIDDDIENEITDAGLFTTLSGIRLGKVTKSDITEYDEQEKRNMNSEESFKVEVSPCCGFFLPKNKFSYINIKAEMDDNWTIIVRETLLEVYGNSISQFSATGKRRFRTKIDPRIFKRLFGWVLSFSKDKATKIQYITVINKFASNKGKYIKSKKKFNKTSALHDERKEPDCLSKCHSNIGIGTDRPNKRSIQSADTSLQPHFCNNVNESSSISTNFNNDSNVKITEFKITQFQRHQLSDFFHIRDWRKGTSKSHWKQRCVRPCFPTSNCSILEELEAESRT
ncbi:hypothetical protein PV328_001003 [Microctonus aethiopoides]|uniref:Uncharacterized protein n=1 Tax=Microctonus aethiopoides TaxID=144406 RepID=A0AA39KX19_9HYME|nr:hypothetical protein PV328_001003 [Microctonus aethiopoides]